ncbi:MAG: HvfC/BufC family peptide modification chaperone [Gammaproteobacteria bacterium]
MNTTPSLHSLQTGFAHWMLGARDLPLPEIIAGNGLDSEARLQIYHNIIFNNLTAALRTAYPAVLKLVGEGFFDGVAARYIRDYPSDSGNLQDFGAAFPECLAAIPEAATLPYLADVARLEWVRQQAYLAADSQPLESNALAAVPDDKQDTLCLTPHPSVRLLESPYPILDIWGFCQQDNGERLVLGDTGQRVLVWRAETQIAMQVLTHVQYVFLKSFLDGQILADAHTSATRIEPGFDMGVCLRWLFSMQLITDYSFV